MYVGTGGTSKDESDPETTRQQPYRGHLVRWSSAFCMQGCMDHITHAVHRQTICGETTGHTMVITSERGIAGTIWSAWIRDQVGPSGKPFTDEGWLEKLMKVQQDSLISNRLIIQNG